MAARKKKGAAKTSRSKGAGKKVKIGDLKSSRSVKGGAASAAIATVSAAHKVDAPTVGMRTG